MIDPTSHQVYLALRRLARDQGRNTQQLFEFYIHERFLARLAASRYAERFVLKGGMLLAVMDLRRATRDADLLARGIANDEQHLRTLITEIVAIDQPDGVSFAVDKMTFTTIREDADYHGIRISLPVLLASARLSLKLDLSFGDTVDAHRIDYPTLLDGPTIPLLGYPIEQVIAEKVETMMALGDANTRDRDYADVYLLIQTHTLLATSVRETLLRVAAHRGHEVRPLGPLLQTLRETRQEPWAAFSKRVALPGLPERFLDVVNDVVRFVDGIPQDGSSRWSPADSAWV